MIAKIITAVPIGSDGLARIGRTVNDLRGLRYEDGDETADSGETDTGSETESEETPAATHDEDVCAAKIADLTAAVAQRDAQITELTNLLTEAKAHNYDLLMQVPGEESEQGSDVADFIPDTVPTVNDDPIDSLFQ